MLNLSPRRRKELIDALRRGTVPQRGLDIMAVGLERFEHALTGELDTVAAGGGVFKAVRGEYGSGKTFFARWLTEQAKQRGFATAEIQISETETPLHKLETVYRRITENLSTEAIPPSAFQEIIDEWFRMLEADSAEGATGPSEAGDVASHTQHLLEQRLANVTRNAPAFAAALRGYYNALQADDIPTADGLVTWLGGQPSVAASVRRPAGIRGNIDHFAAFGFLQGLLTVLRDSDYSGLILVLDEVETLQRVRSDVREKSLNALRQLIDEIDAGRFPGLYILITGTPAFYDGTQGVQRLPPLVARISADFSGDLRWDNPRAPQLRLTGFQEEHLTHLGARVRDIYAAGSPAAERITALIDDAFLTRFARSIAGQLGGRTGIAPRLFLRRLVDTLDRVEQFPDFIPDDHANPTVSSAELTDEERAASGLDDIDIDV